MMPFKSLSFRLKTLTLLWMLVAVGSIILTLLLSWRLEGGAAAINDVGSLRMQTYRLGLLARQQNSLVAGTEKIAVFDHTLETLNKGDPSRPLFLPDNPQVKQQMQMLQNEWQREMKPMFQTALTQNQAVSYERLNTFIKTINNLAITIEEVNTRYIDWLRLFQTILLGLVSISSIVMVVLLTLWVIRPLRALEEGAKAVNDGHFGVQVPVEDSTEFARVDTSFNRMSTRLHELLTSLEQEVAEKTRDLTAKNYSLATLYDVSRLFHHTQTAAEAAQGFLDKIMAVVPAQAGSIRLIDPLRERLDLIAHTGLPEELQTAEACSRFDDCHCGQAVQQSEWQPIRFHEKNQISRQMKVICQQTGFHYLRVFPISYKDDESGMLTLYFSKTEDVIGLEDLLQELCRQFGRTLSNLRLAGESRQLAVLQERNLMAQGLHDSIAQTLNFLKMQTQMLDNALRDGEQDLANENLKFIKEGVEECYDDVRELLLNFRTKISRKEFSGAVQTLVQRFNRQTHIQSEVEWKGTGPALSAEQQLQFVFILQESLSNIRKHSHATHAKITFDNGDDFVMTICDDGEGFDLEAVRQRAGHVGLNIMCERAERIKALLKIDSQPGGTKVCLTLPKQERILE